MIGYVHVNSIGRRANHCLPFRPSVFTPHTSPSVRHPLCPVLPSLFSPLAFLFEWPSKCLFMQIRRYHYRHSKTLSVDPGNDGCFTLICASWLHGSTWTLLCGVQTSADICHRLGMKARALARLLPSHGGPRVKLGTCRCLERFISLQSGVLD